MTVTALFLHLRYPQSSSQMKPQVAVLIKITSLEIEISNQFPCQLAKKRKKGF